MRRSGSLLAVALAVLPSGAWAKKAPAKKQSKTKMQASRLIVQAGRSCDRGQFTAAIALAEKATRLDFTSSTAYAELGNAYYHRAAQRARKSLDVTDARRAIAALETARGLDKNLKNVPKKYRFYYGLAMCYDADHKPAKALDALVLAMRSSPRNPIPAFAGSALSFRQRKPGASAFLLKEGLARANRLHQLDRFLHLAKEDPEYSRALAYSRNRTVLMAFETLDRPMIAKAPRAPSAHPDRETLVDALNAAPKTAMPEPAKTRIQPRSDPNAEFLFRQANRSADVGHYRESIQQYSAALAGTAEPVKRSLILEKTAVSYRKLGLLQDALRSLTGSLQAMPTNAQAYYELAVTYSIAGRYQKAIEALSLSTRYAASRDQKRRILVLARVEPELDPLRARPDFKAIVK